jgi:hypothetical protein
MASEAVRKLRKKSDAASANLAKQLDFGYLETLGDPDLARKATIPLFKEFMGTEEIALPEAK